MTISFRGIAFERYRRLREYDFRTEGRSRPALAPCTMAYRHPQRLTDGLISHRAANTTPSSDFVFHRREPGPTGFRINSILSIAKPCRLQRHAMASSLAQYLVMSHSHERLTVGGAYGLTLRDCPLSSEVWSDREINTTSRYGKKQVFDE